MYAVTLHTWNETHTLTNEEANGVISTVESLEGFTYQIDKTTGDFQVFSPSGFCIETAIYLGEALIKS